MAAYANLEVVSPNSLASTTSTQEPPIITVDGLVKRFGDFTAVNNIQFQVREGEIFGFLGPNGAGKSTTIKMLCTLLRPTSGQITVAGYNVLTHPDAVRSVSGSFFKIIRWTVG